MLIPTPSRRLMREYRQKERLELKLAVCKEKIRVLEERDIEILEHQRDTAVKYIEKRMVQDVVEGNAPCEVCAKASATPCEGCDPQWYGREL